MTEIELRRVFNDTFPPYEEWPATYEVDAETYGNCCQAVFNRCEEVFKGTYSHYDITLGQNKGLMYKGVELLIKK